jgi:hypothetical protein
MAATAEASVSLRRAPVGRRSARGDPALFATGIRREAARAEARRAVGRKCTPASRAHRDVGIGYEEGLPRWSSGRSGSPLVSDRSNLSKAYSPSVDLARFRLRDRLCTRRVPPCADHRREPCGFVDRLHRTDTVNRRITVVIVTSAAIHHAGRRRLVRGRSGATRHNPRERSGVPRPPIKIHERDWCRAGSARMRGPSWNPVSTLHRVRPNTCGPAIQCGPAILRSGPPSRPCCGAECRENDECLKFKGAFLRLRPAGGPGTHPRSDRAIGSTL